MTLQFRGPGGFLRFGALALSVLIVAAPAVAGPAVRPERPHVAAGPAPSVAARQAAPGNGPIASFLPLTRLAATGNGDGATDHVDARLKLAQPATVTADVLSYEGEPIQVIVQDVPMAAGGHTVTWNPAGLADGPYLLRVTAADATGSQSEYLSVAKVSRLAYPANPGSVVVFLDPGHGGPDQGATAKLPDGTVVRESDLDLDIALKVAAMLRAAGIRVSMSRTEDVEANRSHADRNGDHQVDGYDEFLARIDGANSVRADMFVAVHNNWIKAGEGRTEAFYCGVGCYGSSTSKALAADILWSTVARLAPLQTPEWQITVGQPAIPEAQRNPTDDYLRFGYATLPAGRHFYVLGPYGGDFRPRSIAMPGTLVESLALTNPTELGILVSPPGRTMLAAAYYDGIAQWLAERSRGARLDSVAIPKVRVGHRGTLKIHVTNNGNVRIPAGSSVTVGAIKYAPPYDSKPQTGKTIGTGYLTKDLAPGASIVLAIPVTPKTAGRQTWKIDLVIGGIRASRLFRMPMLQLHVPVGR